MTKIKIEIYHRKWEAFTYGYFYQHSGESKEWTDDSSR